MMTSPSFHIFRPAEGAVLDLDSLKAIAATSDRLLTAYLDARWPGISGLVLDGLEMSGDWASGGPPGTRRPDSQSTGVRLSPGSAIVTSRDGRKFMLRVEEELRVSWPTRAGSAVRGVLVLDADQGPQGSSEHLDRHDDGEKGPRTPHSRTTAPKKATPSTPQRGRTEATRRGGT